MAGGKIETIIKGNIRYIKSLDVFLFLVIVLFRFKYKLNNKIYKTVRLPGLA